MREAHLLKGKEIAGKLQLVMRTEIEACRQKYGVAPKIVAVSVTDDQASAIYLRNQAAIAEKVGIEHEIKHYDAAISEAALVAEIAKLNADDSVHGVIVQMPLPEHIRIGKIFETLDPHKDVEGVTADNLGLLVLKKGKLAPCTALAVMELIDSTGIDLYGVEAVVVGASKIVGSPVSLMLTERMATTTVCTIGTSDKKKLEEHVRRAELLVVAVGKAGVIPGEWIKEGATVIDVGINRVGGKTVGDVAFDTAVTRARHITPVPGGVGPLTVTILMKNVLTAYNMQMVNKK